MPDLIAFVAGATLGSFLIHLIDPSRPTDLSSQEEEVLLYK